MAEATRCQTPGAVFATCITPESVIFTVSVPPGACAALADLTEEDAALLETNLHNAAELALAPLWHLAPKVPGGG